VTIDGATFATTGPNAFYFSPNAGIYSAPWGAYALSEAGQQGDVLNSSFAQAQASVTFLFSLSDFLNASGLPDVIDVTTSTGVVLTATATLQSNGDAYPEGTFSWSSGPPSVGITSISIMTDSSNVRPLTIANQVTTAVPEPGTWALMVAGLGALGATIRGRRRTS